MVSEKKMNELSLMFYKLMREQKCDTVEYGIFIGKLSEHVLKRMWKKIEPTLLSLSKYYFDYFCDVEDAKVQLESLIEKGEFIEKQYCNEFGSGRLSPEKLLLTKQCTRIDDDYIKEHGMSSSWMCNPKYHWEWQGEDKYGRTAYDFTYMISRGPTMSEFYGGNCYD